MRGWAVTGAVAFGVAGFLFAASATSADGTNLRSDTAALKDLVAQRAFVVDQVQRDVAAQQEVVERLRQQQGNRQMADLDERTEALTAPVGLLPITGPGVTVVLDDADPEGNEEANPDDLVVHQQDVQAVVNAMWRAGADAVQVMDQRLINTSAVRCVGNTLILQGRVYSPPFSVIGVGDIEAIQTTLERDNYLRGYQAAVEFFGLGYQMSSSPSVSLPGYDGPAEITQAVPLEEGAPR